MGQKYFSRHPILARVMKIIFYVVLLILLVIGVSVFLSMGLANAAVAFAMSFTLFMWPLLMKDGASKLHAIRTEYVSAVRADGTPTVSVPQIMALYALILSPSFVLAFLAFIMPWGVGAIGVLFVPSLMLYILFACLHGGVWGDVGLRRIWYVLYLVAMYVTVVFIALGVKALT